MTITVLFFGDIVGKFGRRAVIKALPELRSEYHPDIVIANIENLSHAIGFTERSLNELVESGVDVFTGGNHSWGNKEGERLLDDPKWKPRLLRPENVSRGKAGRGHLIWSGSNGERIMVVNVMGAQCMGGFGPIENPFSVFDTVYESEPNRPPIVIVDMHAELTAEKEAFGHFADGRVSAVIGTHTHIQTSDARILHSGTAYCTDIGRCASHDSVIGFEKKSVIERFLGRNHSFYDLDESGVAEIDFAVITIDIHTGKACSINACRKILEISER